MKKKVVVIGGSGFMGSHIADELTRSGYAVTLFDYKQSPYLRSGQKMVVGNILDEKALDDCIKGSQYVYHLAGIADIGEAAVHPVETVKTNILGTTFALEVSKKWKVERFVFASTIYVYSHQGSFYRATKQASESLIEVYKEKFGLEYTILRYGSLYGPRSQVWNGLRRYVEQALRDGMILYDGTGEELREFIHVIDAARLSVLVLMPKYANICLTLTGTQVLRLKELFYMVQEIIGKPLDIKFSSSNKNYDHYITTPYRYTPKQALKMVPETFIDIGQGILALVEEINQRIQDEGN